VSISPLSYGANSFDCNLGALSNQDSTALESEYANTHQQYCHEQGCGYNPLQQYIHDAAFQPDATPHYAITPQYQDGLISSCEDEYNQYVSQQGSAHNVFA
jgi:hypothetical protein